MDIQDYISLEKKTNKVKVLGFMDNGTGKHQSNTVYDSRCISPAITTLQGGTQQIKIMVFNDDRTKR